MIGSSSSSQAAKNGSSSRDSLAAARRVGLQVDTPVAAPFGPVHGLYRFVDTELWDHGLGYQPIRVGRRELLQLPGIIGLDPGLVHRWIGMVGEVGNGAR